MRGLQWFQLVGSVVVAPGLQSTGSISVAQRLSCSAVCGIVPDQRSIRDRSGASALAALASGFFFFFTTEPPGKPYITF